MVGTDPALGATWTLQAISTSPTVDTMIDQVTGVQTSAAGIALTLHPVPGLSAPAGGATGVNTQSQFSWSASDFPAAYVVSFTSSAGRPTFTVVTAALNASIPVNQTQGVSLPSGAIYTWTVSAVGPFSTIDAAATSFGPNMAYHQSTAPTRTFTTQ